MTHRNYRRCLKLITQIQQSPSHYLTRLHEKLDFPLITSAELSTENGDEHHQILVIDYVEKYPLIKNLEQQQSASHQYELILVNVPYRLKTEELLTLGNIKGLFYQDASLDDIEVGFHQIINGKNWLPRDVMTQLLYYYRHHFHNRDISAATTLTSRELQILRCLQTHASNLQIADSLFISEVTVKSHLYQIFKKISVRNRNQAIIWANRNIVS